MNKCVKWTNVPNYFESMRKLKSYAHDKLNLDHFIIWPWPSTYLNKCFNETSTCWGEQLCAIIIKSMHKCTVIVWTSSIYDHFLICLSSVTLTFNQPQQMFQMALLLLKDNNCAKLFWNPCINVKDMARTSSVYDHFIIWPWPSTNLNKCFKWHFYS